MNADEARSELEVIEAWIQDLAARRQQEPNHMLRAAYLNGWLAAKAEIAENAEAD